jgi:hypothetical protein
VMVPPLLNNPAMSVAVGGPGVGPSVSNQFAATEKSPLPPFQLNVLPKAMPPVLP